MLVRTKRDDRYLGSRVPLCFFQAALSTQNTVARSSSTEGMRTIIMVPAMAPVEDDEDEKSKRQPTGILKYNARSAQIVPELVCLK